jgi:hypothetical protein
MLLGRGNLFATGGLVKFLDRHGKRLYVTVAGTVSKSATKAEYIFDSGDERYRRLL